MHVGTAPSMHKIRAFSLGEERNKFLSIMCKTAGNKKESKEERLRRKLVNNELNPVADFLLSILILALSPFIYMFAQIHDKLMFKFLNKTYIYNVSWEVMHSS